MVVAVCCEVVAAGKLCRRSRRRVVQIMGLLREGLDALAGWFRI